jgi:phosphoserine phosphatase
MANEVNQAEARFGVNPSLAMVCTSDITNDIAMTMIAGIRIVVYLGSRRRPVAWFLREGLRS